MTEQVDVVVLGMGPGGEEVAGRLAEAGLDVVGIDGKLLGGECPYWGCVPSKMMIRAANLLAEGRRIPGMAGTSTVTPDWAPVARRIRDEATDNWNDQVAVDRFVGKGGRFVRGWGRLDGPRRVVVGDDVYEARRAVVVRRRGQGVGAAHPGPGRARRAVLDQPRRHRDRDRPVVAGGARRRGHRRRARPGLRPLRRRGVDRRRGRTGCSALEEPESSALVAEVLGATGSHIHTSARITGVRHERRRRHGSSSSSTGTAPVTGERLLVAHGAAARPRGAQRGQHRRRRRRRAACPSTTTCASPTACGASGDVTGIGAFTHVSMYQANICVEDILGHDPAPGGLPGAAARDLHRSRDRLGGAERGRGAPTRARRAGGELPDPGLDAGMDPQGGQRGVHQARRGRRRAACSWVPPRPAPPAARCCRC